MYRFASWLLLVLLLAVVFLSKTDGEDVYVGGHALPSTCLLRTAGVDECPGCGMSRSVVYLASAEWGKSFAAHPAGFLAALLVILHFVRNTLRRGTTSYMEIRRWERPLACLFAALVLFTWLGRIFLEST